MSLVAANDMDIGCNRYVYINEDLYKSHNSGNYSVVKKKHVLWDNNFSMLISQSKCHKNNELCTVMNAAASIFLPLDL